MKKTLGITVFSLAGALISSTALAVPVLINGSLTGPIANAGVPPGWVINAGSPDTMDEFNNAGGATPFATTPSPSPDGGTWVGVGDDGGSFIEIFEQLVAGFNVGSNYMVSWYQANFGALTGPGYTTPDAIALSVDGAVAGTGSVSALAPGWTAEGVQFTATQVSHTLAFGSAIMPGFSYISIDGISVSEMSPPIPVPGTLALVALGLLGVGARRRLVG